MAKINALASVIALIHGDRIATIESMTDAFTADYGHFARSNNREPLNAAAKSLGKTPKDKAIADAITAGYKTGELVTGYIGAQSGKFASQPDNVRSVFDGAVQLASDAFKASIESSEAFADKVPKSDADKAKAKADKADKAQSAADALITAKVQAGELVRASDVKALGDFGALALVEALQGMVDAGTLSDGALMIIKSLAGMPALVAEHAALVAEHAALVAEHAALVADTAKSPKARKTVTV